MNREVNKLKIILLGDLLITKNIKIKNKDRLLNKLLHNSDFVIGNLESIYCISNNLYPSYHSGGSWIKTIEDISDTLNFFNVSCLSTSNNHSFDFGYNGILSTINNLRANNIIHVGSGDNLISASKTKKYKELDILSCYISKDDYMIAGEADSFYLNRPGINHLRLKEIITVDNNTYQHLIKIKTEIDNNINEKSLTLNDIIYMKGKKIESSSIIHKKDRNRITTSLKNSSNQNKLLSIHYHSNWIKKPPYFLKHLVHESINNGANIIMCHGPHDNKPITLKENYVVFWGLGSFIYHIDDLNIQPKEFDIKYNIPKNIVNLKDKITYRKYKIKNNPSTNPKNWLSFIPEINITNGVIEQINIYPITLDFCNINNHKGWPKLSRNLKHIVDIIDNSEISKDFMITIKKDYIQIKNINYK